MSKSLLKRLGALLAGAAAAILVVGVTSAVAGSGIGGVFNLGQSNTVDAQTSLSGSVGGNPQLRVENSSSSMGAAGVVGKMTSGSAAADSSGVKGVQSGAGSGVFGQATTGFGVLGKHTSSTGAAAGVHGETSSTSANAAGVHGKLLATTGTNAAGVRGEANPGSNCYCGYGVLGTNTYGFGAGGYSEHWYGVSAASGSGTALYAYSSGGGDAAFLNGDVQVGGRGVIPSHITYWPTNAISASAAEDSLLVVSNTAPTPIKTITGGTNDQRLTLLFTNANSTVGDLTGNLKLAGTFAATADDVLELMYYGSYWVEVGRSAN